MDVVKKIESYGAASGRPTAKIVIADCGQLRPKTVGSVPNAPVQQAPTNPMRGFFDRLLGRKQDS
jgi:hypothetical protein